MSCSGAGKNFHGTGKVKGDAKKQLMAQKAVDNAKSSPLEKKTHDVKLLIFNFS